MIIAWDQLRRNILVAVVALIANVKRSIFFGKAEVEVVGDCQIVENKIGQNKSLRDIVGDIGRYAEFLAFPENSEVVIGMELRIRSRVRFIIVLKSKGNSFF